MDKYEDEILINTTGRGMNLTKVYNTNTKNTNYAYGIEAINQAISLILETRVGESLSNPKFGSTLKEIVFDNNIGNIGNEVKVIIREDLAKWEPRIDVTSIDVIEDYTNGGKVRTAVNDMYWAIPIIIHYSIRRTGIVGEFKNEIYVRGKSFER